MNICLACAKPWVNAQYHKQSNIFLWLQSTCNIWSYNNISEVAVQESFAFVFSRLYLKLKGLLCSFGFCPGTCSVDQAGLELRDPLVSASQVLGLKACTIITWLRSKNLLGPVKLVLFSWEAKAGQQWATEHQKQRQDKYIRVFLQNNTPSR